AQGVELAGLGDGGGRVFVRCAALQQVQAAAHFTVQLVALQVTADRSAVDNGIVQDGLNSTNMISF
ncbi:hypothetical protein, partial [Paracidovorax sp. MALMAid1276]|uniref:hypothetical protein n=1 Tax=Paracidovorax sp. MALMAid1276 TaxID=3411631 RepID=UPI003B9AE362